MSLSRDLLVSAFPNNPRLRAELEELADFLDSASEQVKTLLASATDVDARLIAIEGEATQPLNGLLTAISESGDDQLGVFEKVDLDEVILREVDSGDDACLVPRNKLMSYVGKGITADRPALSAQRRSIYFDTTLATDGKPVFWTGTQWVDATGAVV